MYFIKSHSIQTLIVNCIYFCGAKRTIRWKTFSGGFNIGAFSFYAEIIFSDFFFIRNLTCCTYPSCLVLYFEVKEGSIFCFQRSLIIYPLHIYHLKACSSHIFFSNILTIQLEPCYLFITHASNNVCLELLCHPKII